MIRPQIEFQINCKNNVIHKGGLFSIVKEVNPGSIVKEVNPGSIVKEKKPGGTLIDKIRNFKFPSLPTTIQSNFCEKSDIPTDFIQDENYINEGAFGVVFDLPGFSSTDDYVIRLTKKKDGKSIDPDEYNGLLIQGHLATKCEYINPVKQIGIYSCGNNVIRYKKGKTSGDEGTISDYGIYGILKKGQMNLEEYIGKCIKYKKRNKKTNKKKNETDFKPFLNVKVALTQFLKGIQCIHDHGFVHLDLKPANIIIDMNNNIQIIDFGFAMKIGSYDAQGKGTSGYKDEDILRNTKLGINHDFKAIVSIIKGVYGFEYHGLIHATEQTDDTRILLQISKKFGDSNVKPKDAVKRAIEKLEETVTEPTNMLEETATKPTNMLEETVKISTGDNYINIDYTYEGNPLLCYITLPEPFLSTESESKSESGTEKKKGIKDAIKNINGKQNDYNNDNVKTELKYIYNYLKDASNNNTPDIRWNSHVEPLERFLVSKGLLDDPEKSTGGRRKTLRKYWPLRKHKKPTKSKHRKTTRLGRKKRSRR